MIHHTYRAADIPPAILSAWGPPETDWQRTIEQAGMTLLTDDAGSWGLIERLNADAIEVHFGALDQVRGRHARDRAREMAAWCRDNLPHSVMLAKTQDRATGWFLRHVGFRFTHEIPFRGSKWRVYRL